LGGKARSQPVPATAVDERKPLPGEHGFRFYPRFYKHLIDVRGHRIDSVRAVFRYLLRRATAFPSAGHVALTARPEDSRGASPGNAYRLVLRRYSIGAVPDITLAARGETDDQRESDSVAVATLV
jgi:hypothetical protein